jgi:hypothetical protein
MLALWNTTQGDAVPISAGRKSRTAGDGKYPISMGIERELHRGHLTNVARFGKYRWVWPFESANLDLRRAAYSKWVELVQNAVTKCRTAQFIWALACKTTVAGDLE